VTIGVSHHGQLSGEWEEKKGKTMKRRVSAEVTLSFRRARNAMKPRRKRKKKQGRDTIIIANGDSSIRIFDRNGKGKGRGKEEKRGEGGGQGDPQQSEIWDDLVLPFGPFLRPQEIGKKKKRGRKGKVEYDSKLTIFLSRIVEPTRGEEKKERKEGKRTDKVEADFLSMFLAYDSVHEEEKEKKKKNKKKGSKGRNTTWVKRSEPLPSPWRFI